MGHRDLHPTEGDDRDELFAVIDVGSNSGRMIVFRLRDGEHLDVVEDARSPLRLARDIQEHGELGQEAIDRTLQALEGFLAIARTAGAERILAVGTSAVREAPDGPALIEGAQRLGISLETIDGDHEARLGFFGAVHDLPVRSGFTMDVGGGSVEIGRFDDRHLVRSWSLPIGSLRTSDAYLHSDPPTGRELKSLRKATARALEEAGITELAGDESLVGIGGTVRNLAKVDQRRTGFTLRLLHGYELPGKRISTLVEDLAGRTMRRRAHLPGLNPDRADTIVGGAMVVEQIVRHVGASSVIVSSRGLREGLALATEGGGIPAPGWVRTMSVATLARRFTTWNAEAADRRATIAESLHQALDPKSPTHVVEMLRHAATLLDIGRAVDYYDRFGHAATIVASADLGGFSHTNLGALTSILRQADDDTRLGHVGRLVEERDRPAVLRAAAALTLADELLRRIDPAAPPVVRARQHDGHFEVQAPIPAGLTPRGLGRRIEKVAGLELTIVATGDSVPSSNAPALRGDDDVQTGA
jgi:exopolyphosphatase/guanosine-5'-triphosphate,3'-diphosphate pyrophosphatase